MGKISIALPGIRESRTVVPYQLASYSFTKNRAFFICGCGRRTEKLFYRNKFACQKCHWLVYRQRRGQAAIIHQAEKVREGLGGKPDLFLPFPKKPDQTTWRRFTQAFLNEKKVKYQCLEQLLKDV